MKISAVYKITNTITGDFYIGSSKNVKRRWANHKCPSIWNKCSNNQMYIDMRKYGIDKFAFEILEEVESEKLKEAEQQFIETLHPVYNNRNANGLDTDKYKEYQKQYQKQYNKQYNKSDKHKESHRKAVNKYNKQLCCYNGEILTLIALAARFRRRGISNPTAEAKKYIITGER